MPYQTTNVVAEKRENGKSEYPLPFLARHRQQRKQRPPAAGPSVFSRRYRCLQVLYRVAARPPENILSPPSFRISRPEGQDRHKPCQTLYKVARSRIKLPVRALFRIDIRQHVLFRRSPRYSQKKNASHFKPYGLSFCGKSTFFKVETP